MQSVISSRFSNSAINKNKKDDGDYIVVCTKPT